MKFEAFSSFAVPIPIPTKLKLQCVFFPLKDGPLGARMIEVDVPRAMPSGEDMADAVSAITGVDKECLRVEEIYHGKVAHLIITQNEKQKSILPLHWIKTIFVYMRCPLATKFYL